ncbi:hypothetical protein [Spirosoma pollinicola]|nr:hypothetical protein [Spirosoma pollinicola]
MRQQLDKQNVYGTWKYQPACCLTATYGLIIEQEQTAKKWM